MTPIAHLGVWRVACESVGRHEGSVGVREGVHKIEVGELERRGVKGVELERRGVEGVELDGVKGVELEGRSRGSSSRGR